jgi:Rieske Fe-S protein
LSGICGAACAATVTACKGQHRSDVPPGAKPIQVTPPPSAVGGSTASVLASTSDIPVGGGRVFPEYRLVVTQPAVGGLRAFTAICTHDGCMLTAVTDATIRCPCHGSRFAIADGTVVNGPATRALTPRPIRVEGDSIILDP